ncbi:hypothetical protein [Aliiruegeria lutimaris]|uniref:Uncharacterized protein n=1 Tax=Aliiruegeria lutimaris TaxID=571298 RepID=A0A1G9LCU3_9RHOB|nr:hypothetical protein [Aliiruegeria lutimaris]SDL59345.1 hypothetical protein SAMN04488026_109612 [Aliiruegeria lutimaris]
MENASHLFTRMSTAQHSLEQLRNDVSQALVTNTAACECCGQDARRFQELHGRLSTALAALHGELREH